MGADFSGKFGENCGFSKRLDSCNDFADVFEVVKDGVEKVLGKSRAGLMLGLANLGGSSGYYIGAYYPIDSNIIVLNTFPLKRIMETGKELFKPYVFSVLLHEYLHSLDYLDEAHVRRLTYAVCARLFGKEHNASRLSYDISQFLPFLSYPEYGWFPKKEPDIKIVQGFDKGNLTYVS